MMTLGRPTFSSFKQDPSPCNSKSRYHLECIVMVAQYVPFSTLLGLKGAENNSFAIWSWNMVLCHFLRNPWLDPGNDLLPHALFMFPSIAFLLLDSLFVVARLVGKNVSLPIAYSELNLHQPALAGKIIIFRQNLQSKCESGPCA